MAGMRAKEQCGFYQSYEDKSYFLILSGKDEKSPPSQGKELYIRVVKNGVPARLVIFPREPHGISEPNHRLFKMRAEFAWFEHYLKGKERKLWEELK